MNWECPAVNWDELGRAALGSGTPQGSPETPKLVGLVELAGPPAAPPALIAFRSLIRTRNGGGRGGVREWGGGTGGSGNGEGEPGSWEGAWGGSENGEGEPGNGEGERGGVGNGEGGKGDPGMGRGNLGIGRENGGLREWGGGERGTLEWGGGKAQVSSKGGVGGVWVPRVGPGRC